MGDIERYAKDLWIVSSRVFNVPNVTMEEHAHPAFLSCNINRLKDIPTALIPYIIKLRNDNIDVDNVALNLVNGFDEEGRRTLHHKTVSTILRRFSQATHSYKRMAHIVTSKGVHYYGSEGLILDANYNPLLLSTVDLEYTNGLWKLSRPVCKISYRVFNNPSELLEKTIIKQFIPIFSRERVCCCIDNRYGLGRWWVRVVIDDLDYMISRPARPRLEDVTPDSINNIILEGYDGL